MLHVGLFTNRWLIAGVTTTVALQLLFTYAAPMNSLFHSAPIDAEAWLRIIAVGFVIWGTVGLEKSVRRRRASGRGPKRHKEVAAAASSL